MQLLTDRQMFNNSGYFFLFVPINRQEQQQQQQKQEQLLSYVCV